jgi:hypothetical protein
MTQTDAACAVKFWQRPMAVRLDVRVSQPFVTFFRFVANEVRIASMPWTRCVTLGSEDAAQK